MFHLLSIDATSLKRVNMTLTSQYQMTWSGFNMAEQLQLVYRESHWCNFDRRFNNEMWIKFSKVFEITRGHKPQTVPAVAGSTWAAPPRNRLQCTPRSPRNPANRCPRQ